jgi:long-subunit acyl-CoA synthetase (AMP-forming)
VEWTLGFALAEIDFVPHHNKIPIVAKNSVKYMLVKQSVTAAHVVTSFFRFTTLSLRSYFRFVARKLRQYMA